MDSVNFKGNCEICGRLESYRFFTYTDKLKGHYEMILTCLECELSFMCQFYQWNNSDVEDYLNWNFGKKEWEK